MQSFDRDVLEGKNGEMRSEKHREKHVPICVVVYETALLDGNCFLLEILMVHLLQVSDRDDHSRYVLGMRISLV